MRILIVEDNARIRSLTVRSLHRLGFSCDGSDTLQAASHALRLTQYGAIVLDLGMPDGDGVAWLARQRTSGLRVPVIMLTARSALDDRVIGLDAGADDYLVKPFAIEELAARLRAVLRRPAVRVDPVIEVGAIRFDTTTRLATCHGVAVALSHREAALLELLMTRAGSVVSRDQIEDSLYSFDEPVTPNAVEVLMSRLRRKLAAQGGDAAFVTLRGIGYLMTDRR